MTYQPRGRYPGDTQHRLNLGLLVRSASQAIYDIDQLIPIIPGGEEAHFEHGVPGASGGRFRSFGVGFSFERAISSFEINLKEAKYVLQGFKDAARNEGYVEEARVLVQTHGEDIPLPLAYVDMIDRSRGAQMNVTSE